MLEAVVTPCSVYANRLGKADLLLLLLLLEDVDLLLDDVDVLLDDELDDDDDVDEEALAVLDAAFARKVLLLRPKPMALASVPLPPT